MKKKSAAAVGFFVFVGIVVLLLFFEMLSGGAALRRGYLLRAYFQSAREIKVGSPIKMGGVEIGKVSAVDLAAPKERGQVRLDLKIRHGVLVHTDSEASIMISSLFGEQFIDITFGKPDSRFLDPESVISTRERSDINAMLDKMDEVATDVRGLVKQLGENPLKPLTDFFEESRPKFTELLDNADKISDKIAKGEGTIGKLVNDPTLYDEAKKTLDDVQKASTDLTDIGANLKSITTDIREGKGTVGKFFKEEEFYKNTNDAAKNLDEILKKINEGKGSIGELINDPALIRNAKVSLQKLDKATDAIEDQGPLSIISILAGALF